MVEDVEVDLMDDVSMVAVFSVEWVLDDEVMVVVVIMCVDMESRVVVKVVGG